MNLINPKSAMMDHARKMNATRITYSGAWPKTLFIDAPNKADIIESIIKRFGRHTQIRLA